MRTHWRIRAVSLGVGLICGCSTIDGAPVDLGPLSGQVCAEDLDCGPGRYCQSGTCAIDCMVARDCGPTRVCSSCGSCVLPGQRADGCLPATDRPCSNDEDCHTSLGQSWSCGEERICQKKCAGDASCADLGRGFGCTAGLCVRQCISDERCFTHGFKFVCRLPPGVDPVVNDEAAVPVVGVCVADPTRIAFPVPGATDPPPAFYAGIWGMILVSAARTQGVPLLGSIDSVSIQHVLVRLTRDGVALVVEQRWCNTELQNFSEDDTPLAIDPFKVVLPDRNIDALHVVRSRIELVPALTSGSSFITSEQLHLSGAKLKKPATDPLPSYKDLTNQWDQDRDGFPGMTAKVTGLLSGDLYQAQRWRPTLSGTVVDRDHLQGLAKGAIDQTILGSSNDRLINDSFTTTHPQPDRSYFRLVRLRNDASCVDVLRLATVDGGWLAFSPHYDPARPVR